MQKILKTGLLSSIAVFALAAAVPLAGSGLPVRAQEATTTTETEKAATLQEKRHAAEAERKEFVEKQRASAEAKISNARETAKVKLTEAKLKACQTREKTITNIMIRHADRGTKVIEVFNKISERTQAFHKEKGKTVSGYDTLVANVNAKKTAAEAAMAEAKSKSTSFSCGGDDPKGVVSAFKDSLHARNQALKAYKAAIKDLIAGVKSAQGVSSSSEKSDSEGVRQ